MVRSSSEYSACLRVQNSSVILPSREEVKKGMREKAGQWIYPSRAPFGYKNNTGKYAARGTKPELGNWPGLERLCGRIHASHLDDCGDDAWCVPSHTILFVCIGNGSPYSISNASH